MIMGSRIEILAGGLPRVLDPRAQDHHVSDRKSSKLLQQNPATNATSKNLILSSRKKVVSIFLISRKYTTNDKCLLTVFKYIQRF